MAKNTIKGITVEIGGDTTKLGEALKNVDKKSRDLSSELGEINRLLKFDPGNADLLAQKQKVLADAVANTKEKLDTLKKAEEQVQKQFERGEVSEEQVRALKREVEKTSQELKQYEKAAEETAQAIDKLGDESDDTGDDLKDTEKGADKAAKELDDLEDSAKKAGDASDGLSSKLGSLAKGGLAAVATGVTALIGAMVGSAEATREYRREMGKLDTAFTTNGHSSEAATKTYKELQGVLGETDQAVEAANHLAKLTDNEQDLEKWTNICTGVYATFGASLPIEGLTEAANETAKVGTLTGSLADALNWAGVNEEAFQAQLDACTTEQERQALITETLNGLYSEAADKYRETNAEIIRANQANEEWMSVMAEVGGAIEPVLTDVKLLGASLLSDLVPGVKAVSDAFRGIMNGDEGSAEALGSALTGIFDSLLDKVVDMAPTVIQVATSLIFTLTESLLAQAGNITRSLLQITETAIRDLTAALPGLLTSLLDAGFGFFTNLAAYLPDVVSALMSFIIQLSHSLLDYATNKLPGWISELVNEISVAIELMVPNILGAAITLFTALIQAIPVIIEALIPEILGLVMSICTALTDNIPLLISGAVQLLNGIILAIPQITTALLEAVPILVTTIVNCLVTNIPILIQGAIDLFNALVLAIPVIIVSLVEQIPSIVTSIVDGLLQLIPVLLEGAQQLLFAIIDAIPFLLDELLPQIPIIVETIINGLLSMTGPLLDASVQLLLMLVEAIPQIVEALIDALPLILDTIVGVLKQLPGLIWNILVDVLSAFGRLFSEAVPKCREGGQKILTAIGEFLMQLPGQVWGWIKGAIDKIVQFGSEATAKAKKAAQDIFDGIVDKIKSISSKMADIGKDIVEGLWNGIKDMTSWITGKLKSFGDSVLGGIKDFFGINSPSRVFRDEVGEMLAAGLAEGIEKNADQPLNAMAELSKDILGEADNFNGLTLARKLEHTFASPSGPSATESGMLDKLDRILSAIERGQILTIDGNSFVGGTVDRYDSALGQRRELVARGAL